MASKIQLLLTSYLDILSKKDLEEFLLQLMDKEYEGHSSKMTPFQLEKANGMKIASFLVAQYGEQKAWELAILTWEKMGLKELSALAKEQSNFRSDGTEDMTTRSWTCSPSKPNLDSPNWPTPSSVVGFWDSKTSKNFQTSNERNLKCQTEKYVHTWKVSFTPHSGSFQSITNSPDHESPNQESPNAPTSTDVLRVWEPQFNLRSESRNQEVPDIEQSVMKTSGNCCTGIKKGYQSQITEIFCPTQPWKNESVYQNFTHLILLHRSAPRCYESLANKNWHHRMMEDPGHFIEVRDLFVPHLATQEGAHIVVLHGNAGIGKSTLVRQVRKAWEEGQLFRDYFQHVFYFNCRDLAQYKKMSLAELMAKDWPSPETIIGQIISQPKKLLFIFDGLGEPRWVLKKKNSDLCVHWSQQQSLKALLSSLLEKTILPEASLLITTRTTNLWKLIPSLKQSRWVEILGFSESGRKDYFYKFFTDESQASRVFNLVESNKALWTMCLIPWVSWLVCTCLKQQMEQGQELSLTCQTTTSLCLQYLSQALPAQSLGMQLGGLCSLAAECTWKGNTLFSLEDLKKHKLDELFISTLLHVSIIEKHPISLKYNFIQPCFQEFFSAMSCIFGSNSPNANSVKNFQGIFYWPDSGKANTHFLFGLLSEQGLREMERVFNHTPSREKKWELLSWAQKEFQNNHSSVQSNLQLFHCLYEIQDQDFLLLAMAYFQGTRIFIQTNMEFLVFTFCIKFCPHLKRLQLNESGQHGQEWSPLNVVVFTRFSITDTCWQFLFSVLGISESLKELDLSGNFLSDNAVEHLFEALKYPDCHLEILRLVNCSLTSSCCQSLASMLSVNTSLTELDLQQNDLGNLGVNLLCEGLRHPSCQLRLLRLEQTQLSEDVKEMLRNLKEEKPQLIIAGIWKPIEMKPNESTREGNMSDYAFKRKRSESEGSSPQIAPVNTLCLSSPYSSEELHIEIMGTRDYFWGPTGPMTIEVLNKERNLYRVHLPKAGSYYWPNTGLHFVVRRPVTVEIESLAWDQFLSRIVQEHSWMIVGPLFGIKTEPGAVKAVYLPHFVAFQEGPVDISQFYVAHFKDEGMVLEKPDRVEPGYTVLENPSFSPLGVVLRMIHTTLSFIPITSSVLLYYHLQPEEVIFHLYLIPSDCSIQKAIDDEEKKFQFVRIHKPPPLTSLYLGSRYTVSGSKKMEVIPQELELCYRSPNQSQLFSEIYVGRMKSEIRIHIKNKKDEIIVWEALVKPGDLRPEAPSVTPVPKNVPTLLHFVDQCREQLVTRVTSVDSILDKLLGPVLTEEEYETVRAETTNQNQMRKLFDFSRSWDWACKDRFYEALKEIHPHLIRELWQVGGSAGK